MKDQESEQWVFTQPELWHLLDTFAPAILLGMADPYFGWEIGRRERSLRKVGAALHKRGIADPERAAGLSPLRTALAACAHPKHSLMVTSQFAGCVQTRRVFHFGEEVLVEHRNLDAGNQILTVIAKKEALFERLAHDLRMDAALPAAGESFSIQESMFFEASRAFRRGSPDRAGEILVSAGVEKPCLEAMTGALRDPVSNASVIAVWNGRDAGRPRVDGWSLLEGGGRIWMLRPAMKENRRMTVWIPVDADGIHTALWGMMP
jgi:hypothetical protein